MSHPHFIKKGIIYKNYSLNLFPWKEIKDFLVQLSMLNFYMEVSFNKKYISKRQYEVVGRFLVEIRKITFGVIRSE